MVKIIATQRIPFGKRRYEIGEEIVGASDKDVKLLVGIGKAKFADQPSATDLPNKAMVAREEAAPEAPERPQTYGRRDMTAAPAGQTGTAKPSRSSRPARRSKAKT